jgi:hypothetical protein
MKLSGTDCGPPQILAWRYAQLCAVKMLINSKRKGSSARRRNERRAHRTCQTSPFSEAAPEPHQKFMPVRPRLCVLEGIEQDLRVPDASQPFMISHLFTQ